MIRFHIGCTLATLMCLHSEASTLCGLQVPPKLESYKRIAEGKFGTIICKPSSQNRDFSALASGGVPTIFLLPGHRKPGYVFHEMMHFWLGTQPGWSLEPDARGPHRIAVSFPNNPDVPSFAEAIGTDLDAYMEHRMFAAKLISVIDGYAEQKLVVDEMLDPPAPDGINPTNVAITYLNVSLESPKAGDYMRERLKQKKWNAPLDAAGEITAIIDQKQPKTQAQSYDVVQDCLLRLFRRDTPYGRLRRW